MPGARREPPTGGRRSTRRTATPPPCRRGLVVAVAVLDDLVVLVHAVGVSSSSPQPANATASTGTATRATSRERRRRRSVTAPPPSGLVGGPCAGRRRPRGARPRARSLSISVLQIMAITCSMSSSSSGVSSRSWIRASRISSASRPVRIATEPMAAGHHERGQPAAGDRLRRVVAVADRRERHDAHHTPSIQSASVSTRLKNASAEDHGGDQRYRQARPETVR